ncbi:MAG: hypothetical protein J5969_09070 [Lachnospiraceae bacterium]|nr:hypothetical protein [Lachnospiraceae bacterium]
MISLLPLWFYIFITTFLMGFGVIFGLRRILCGFRGSGAPDFPRSQTMISCSIAGLAAATVFAQFWSLAGGIGAAANLVLCLLCLLPAIFLRPQLRHFFERKALPPCSQLHLAKVTALCLLVLFFAYAASHGYLHVDTGLYHAQSIRWAEEYGAVPGLALLHNRLGYNSAAFPLTALYSMKFLTGRSLHGAAGYLALLVAVECLPLLRIPMMLYRAVAGNAAENAAENAAVSAADRRQLCILPSDFVRAAAVYYISTILDEMVSPASDYFMVLLTFHLVLRTAVLLEQEERDWFPYALLTFLAVFNTTVKLSAAPQMLIVFYPLWMIFHEGGNAASTEAAEKIGTKAASRKTPGTEASGREQPARSAASRIILSILTGVFIAAPYFARNVIMTGYLIYPLASVDLFDLPWKIEWGYAASDQKEIAVWGRGYTDVYMYEAPFSYWLPFWFRSQGAVDKAALLADLVTVPVMLAAAAVAAFGGKKKSQLWQPLFLTVIAGLAFWFFGAPLMRYGCVYCYLAAILIPMLWTSREIPEKRRRIHRRAEIAACAVIMLFLLYKGTMAVRE